MFQSVTSEGVIPAQFDWNNSGLTNPLAENGKSNDSAFYYRHMNDINFSISCSGVHLSLLDIEFFTNTSIDTKNRPQNSKFTFKLFCYFFAHLFYFFSR